MASAPRHSFCDIQNPPVPAMQGAFRSEWQALHKGRNAAMAVQARSLRAGQEAVIRGVMPVEKGWAISCQAGLVVNRFPAR